MVCNESWLRVGKFVSPQGLRGEIRVQPLSDFPERFTKPGKRWLQTNQKNKPLEVELISGRKLPGKEIFILRFEEIKNRNEAQLLIGASLLVPSSQRPELAENEFHLLDLVGLKDC